MFQMNSWITFGIVILITLQTSKANDFPSLLVANATMGNANIYKYKNKCAM